MYSAKFNFAKSGPLDAHAPFTKCGYFCRNQTAIVAEYEPPTTTTPPVAFNVLLAVIVRTKFAKSAND